MKKIFSYTILSFLICFFSCKQDAAKARLAENQGTPSLPDTLVGNLNPNSSKNDTANLVPPSPCDLISPSELKSIFKINAEVTYNVGSDGLTDKSCFFRIEDKKPNGAILIQISTNPLPAELVDYPIKIIEGKMTHGEQDPVSDKSAIFTALPALGDMGCYNYSMGKYHWQYNKEYLFHLAFNTSHNEADQKAMAIEVAKIINQKFQSQLNKS